MSPTLSPAKADRLYWLGRYAQRTLATTPGAADLLDSQSPGSLVFNLSRAYDNGFLLRDVLDNDVFSYLRMASTKASVLSTGDYLRVREVYDALYAFWGILEESVEPQADALCRWGRYLELWEQRTREGRGEAAEAAWGGLQRCWATLRVGEPEERDPSLVEAWFGQCFGAE